MAFDMAGSLGTEAERSSMPDQKLSDHQLIEATKAGDEAAFGEIMNRYRSPITNYLYRFLNDYEEAVDLAQETFVRVYFAIDRYHTGFAFSTYIYRIATNLAISDHSGALSAMPSLPIAAMKLRGLAISAGVIDV